MTALRYILSTLAIILYLPYTHAQTITAHSSLPQELSQLIHFGGEEIKKAPVERINELLQKFPFDQKKNMIEPQLNNFLKQTFYKWLLSHSSTIREDFPVNHQLILEANQKMEFSSEKELFPVFIQKKIHYDLQQMIINNPNLKNGVQVSKLTNQERKISSYLLPWLEIVKQARSTPLVASQLRSHLKQYPVYLAEKLELYTTLLNKKNKLTDIVFLSYQDSKNQISGKPQSNLPLPVDDWNDRRQEVKAPLKPDQQGLPIPVNDWILDF